MSSLHPRHPSALVRFIARSAFPVCALAALGLSHARAAAAQTVDPDVLQSRIVSVSGEGALCPEGSFSTALNLTETTATVILSQSLGGVQTAGCKLTFELEVPDGLTLGMPTTILRGVALEIARASSAATRSRVPAPPTPSSRSHPRIS